VDAGLRSAYGSRGEYEHERHLHLKAFVFVLSSRSIPRVAWATGPALCVNSVVSVLSV